MRVLVACEFTGVVRDAFSARGHNAWSCDLLPSDAPGNHLTRDVLGVLHWRWDLLVAHPPCTYLSSSGLHWNTKDPSRDARTRAALSFVRALMDAPIKRICVENPVGRIGTAIRPADQYIQPYQFGEDASKRTGLWLKGLPRLRPTSVIGPRWVAGKARWGNQTDSGQNRLGPSPERWKLRSATYPGVAAAMAEQWGGPLDTMAISV